jgi:hypothetical protein
MVPGILPKRFGDGLDRKNWSLKQSFIVVMGREPFTCSLVDSAAFTDSENVIAAVTSGPVTFPSDAEIDGKRKPRHLRDL